MSGTSTGETPYRTAFVGRDPSEDERRGRSLQDYKVKLNDVVVRFDLKDPDEQYEVTFAGDRLNMNMLTPIVSCYGNPHRQGWPSVSGEQKMGEFIRLCVKEGILPLLKDDKVNAVVPMSRFVRVVILKREEYRVEFTYELR